MEPCRGESGKQAHGGTEDYAFGRTHEAGKYGEDAYGTADKESPENKAAHTEPHGRFFSRRIKKEVFVIIYGRPLFCQCVGLSVQGGCHENVGVRVSGGAVLLPCRL